MNKTLFDRLLDHVGFSAADAEVLAEFHPHVAPSFQALATSFYRHQLRDQITRRVLHDEAQVARLMLSMQQWLSELFLAPRDEAYLKRRLYVGELHVENGLLPDFVFTSMAQMRTEIRQLINACGAEAGRKEACLVAIDRSLDLELALITGSQHEVDRYRDMVDVAPEMIHGVDREGRFVFINRTEELRIGRDRHELLGTKLEALVVPEDRQILRDHLERVFGTGSSSCELRMQTVGGGIMHAEILAVARRDTVTGEFAVSRAYVRDITERRRVERELRESQSLARLGAMAAVVAHEVRNPLAGISGAVQIIGEALAPDAPERAIVREIVDRIAGLNGAVNDMLLYARPRLPRVEPISLQRLASDVISLARADRGFGTAGVLLEGEDITCLGDAELLKPVILNLIVNAAQAKVGGVIRVRTYCADGLGQLSVEDEGSGIPAALRERVFEPFFTTKHQGSGLGLSIAKRLVEAHQGSVRIEDAATGGARIVVALPLANGS
jgi:PAS domain S-box-containing protein